MAPVALRVLLDTGVLLDGCISVWSAAKAVLILAVYRQDMVIVLPDAVDEEMRRVLAREATIPATADAGRAYAGWLARVRVERTSYPSVATVQQQAARILPVLRHANDLPVVVSAIEAQPDWVLSTNTAPWGELRAERTGLRIATPQRFRAALGRHLT